MSPRRPGAVFGSGGAGRSAPRLPRRPLHRMFTVDPSTEDRTDLLRVLIRIENTKLLLLLFMALVLAAFVLDIASQILIPVTLAWFLSTLFTPIVRNSARLGIPQPATSLVIVLALIGMVLVLISFVSEPAGEWIKTLPDSLRELRDRMAVAGGSLTELRELTVEVKELAAIAEQKQGPEVVGVVVDGPGWLEGLLTNEIPMLSSILLITLILTWFMLASGDEFLRSVVRYASDMSVKKRVVRVSRQIQSDLSRYLLTISVINGCLAVVVGCALWALGVEAPFFWGLIAGLLNFAPYVGPLVTAFLLLLVGVSSFDALTDALLVPGVFLVITSIEGQMITPTVVGRALSLHPTVVFLSVLILTWLWGMVGALMAAPLLTTLRILWSNTPELREILFDNY